jgi:hypothetical protein
VSEVSVVRDAARVRVDWRDLNPFAVRDTEGKPDIERELPRRTHVEHVERDAQPADSKGEMIARAHCARGAYDQLEPGPLRQFARVREETPDALGGGENDVGRTNFHTTASLSPYYPDARKRWFDELRRKAPTRKVDPTAGAAHQSRLVVSVHRR